MLPEVYWGSCTMTYFSLPKILNPVALIPVAVRSKAWVCGHSPAEIVGSNPNGDMDVCVLSDRGLCVCLITHPEESYQVWFV